MESNRATQPSAIPSCYQHGDYGRMSQPASSAIGQLGAVRKDGWEIGRVFCGWEGLSGVDDGAMWSIGSEGGT